MLLSECAEAHRVNQGRLRDPSILGGCVRITFYLTSTKTSYLQSKTGWNVMAHQRY